MKRGVAFLGLMALAACELPPPDPARVADRCEERARAAQGPTAGLTVGVNSNSGGFAEGNIGLTSDYLAGRDPIQVYESCVFRQTGALPIRPPVLRDI